MSPTMTDELIEAIALAIRSGIHQERDSVHMARAALGAISAQGWMLCRWEKRQTNVDMMLAIAEARRAGYVLTGLEPPKGG